MTALHDSTEILVCCWQSSCCFNNRIHCQNSLYILRISESVADPMMWWALVKIVLYLHSLWWGVSVGNVPAEGNVQPTASCRKASAGVKIRNCQGEVLGSLKGSWKYYFSPSDTMGCKSLSKDISDVLMPCPLNSDLRSCFAEMVPNLLQMQCQLVWQ